MSAIAKIAAGRQAGGIGKLHLLIGATAAIVLVLGLLQIAGILVSSSDRTGLIMRTDTAVRLPLVKVLEAGTWFAGRALAAERRNDGGPPIAVESDGTVF